MLNFEPAVELLAVYAICHTCKEVNDESKLGHCRACGKNYCDDQDGHWCSCSRDTPDALDLGLVVVGAD